MKPNHPTPWTISYGKIIAANGLIVCSLPSRKSNDSANLIVAAPELLSALRNLLKDHKRMFPEAHPNSTIKWSECVEVKQARAAIAKAEGVK